MYWVEVNSKKFQTEQYSRRRKIMNIWCKKENGGHKSWFEVLKTKQKAIKIHFVCSKNNTIFWQVDKKARLIARTFRAPILIIWCWSSVHQSLSKFKSIYTCTRRNCHLLFTTKIQHVATFTFFMVAYRTWKFKINWDWYHAQT